MGFGPTKKACFWFLTGALPLLSALAVIYPCQPGIATYDGVGPARGRKITAPAGSGRLLTVGGMTYMLRCETSHALVLTTFVHNEMWTDAELDSIERMFPGYADPLPTWYARHRDQDPTDSPRAISP
ncbi:hypothetical protein [Paludisphaera soli]|uniref:hypothetical protein n=1 Tax=Paludisphaera soli TaxID=2712865 RepID=UPI0013E9A18C|nr:hypothetical protein [Paludisphaera soli]